METIILVIHLLIAVAIIGLVLIQRSSGGGLGIGGSGGMGDFATARGTANTLQKLTTYFAIAFFATSLTLGYMAAHNGEQGVLESLESEDAAQIEMPVVSTSDDAPAEPEVPTGE